MITLDLSILNQKGTPMFNSDLFANRPAAGIVGRIFISTDTNLLYRDNGTTWDLLGGGGGGGTISGSIAAGQVAFGTALNTIGGENNLFWDSTNDRLGIRTNIPSDTLHIVGTSLITGASNFGGNMNLTLNHNNATQFTITNTTAGQFAIPSFNVVSDSLSGNGIFGKRSSLASAYKILLSSDFQIYNGTIAGDIGILNDFSTGKIKLSTAGVSIAQATLFPTGNLAIGTTTDIGDRLYIVGNARIFGTLNMGIPSIFPTTDDGNSINTGSGGLFIGYTSGPTYTGVTRLALGANPGQNLNATTGLYPLVGIVGTFNPVSGSATLDALTVRPTINQTGGANGITRGLYINPNLTSAANWRSIEWSNNTGWGIYGSGTASSYLAGKLLIGSTIDNTYTLQVTGNQSTTQTTTYTSGVVHSNVVVRNTTFNAGAISGSTGICNFVGTGDNIINGNLSVPNTTSFAGIYQYNKYQFGAAALTFTVSQASPGGLRAVSQLFTQNVFKGSNSGTITHMAGMQIGGFYNENTGTITPVIPNVYQLLINDTGAYLHTFTFTNRWGIYQEGINDRNYFAGNLLLNSTTDTGQILQITGAIRVNGQASGTAGGASGNHLIINVDGTQYKIALLNP
jgi:hypothetical protein